jgi:hypothetical protein
LTANGTELNEWRGTREERQMGFPEYAKGKNQVRGWWGESDRRWAESSDLDGIKGLPLNVLGFATSSYICVHVASRVGTGLGQNCYLDLRCIWTP